jgi:hypothetical protein
MDHDFQSYHEACDAELVFFNAERDNAKVTEYRAIVACWQELERKREAHK